MLLNVTVNTIDQRCAACGLERTLDVSTLWAGLVVGDPPIDRDPNIIALPSCSGCDAVEYLNRVAGTNPAEHNAAADHRRGVNALHAALVASKRVPEALDEHFANEAVVADTATLPWSFASETVARKEAR